MRCRLFDFLLRLDDTEDNDDDDDDNDDGDGWTGRLGPDTVLRNGGKFRTNVRLTS